MAFIAGKSDIILSLRILVAVVEPDKWENLQIRRPAQFNLIKLIANMGK